MSVELAGHISELLLWGGLIAVSPLLYRASYVLCTRLWYALFPVRDFTLEVVDEETGHRTLVEVRCNNENEFLVDALNRELVKLQLQAGKKGQKCQNHL